MKRGESDDQVEGGEKRGLYTSQMIAGVPKHTEPQRLLFVGGKAEYMDRSDRNFKRGDMVCSIEVFDRRNWRRREHRGLWIAI